MIAAILSPCSLTLPLNRFAAWASAVGAALILAACGGGGGSDNANTSAAVAAPTILAQPSDVSVVEGGTANFAVTAAGTGVSYQWSSSIDGVNFVAVAGATNATLTVPMAALVQSGLRYHVVVSNSGGVVASSAVRLTVTALIVAPTISVQPTAQSVTAPATATFNVTVAGTTPSYQWQVSTDNGVSYGPVAGGPNAPTLAIVGTTTTQDGQRYRVVVSNSAGAVTSSAALLSIAPTPVAPVITAQPADLLIVAGQSATFTVTAVGTPPPAFQWRLNGSSLVNGVQPSGPCAGGTVSGAATATMTIAFVPVGCSGSFFSVLASNGATPDAVSRNTLLVVNPAPVPPAIYAQPGSAFALTDATASFSVGATGTAVTYQWLRNGVAIVGANGQSYTTPPITWVDSNAAYSVVVANVVGSVTSTSAGVVLLRSGDQNLADAFSMAGSYQVVWNLNSAGGQTAGTNFASYDSSVTALSPLTNGPQPVVQSARVNLTSTLPIVLGGPTRVLKAGTILVVPSHDQTLRASYMGSQVRVDSLAADNTTVAYSQLRSNYFSFSISGDIKTSAPAVAPDLAHFLNSFYTNPATLRSGVPWPAGSGFLKFDSVFLGDRYVVLDCAATTTDANPSPCYISTTLTSALASGIVSSSDLTTYHSSDGTFVNIGGVDLWIANVARPVSATLTAAQQFRIYFELNGNVYTGSLTRDGQPFGGSYYVSTPGIGVAGLTFLPFNIRLNHAAIQGLAAAITY